RRPHCCAANRPGRQLPDCRPGLTRPHFLHPVKFPFQFFGPPSTSTQRVLHDSCEKAANVAALSRSLPRPGRARSAAWRWRAVMTQPLDDFTELRDLLDPLCEGTITAAQMRRLEELILASPAAEG